MDFTASSLARQEKVMWHVAASSEGCDAGAVPGWVLVKSCVLEAVRLKTRRR